MFRDIVNTDGNELVASRLERLQSELRALDLPTKIELQAEVMGRLNRVLALGNRVSPLVPAGAAGPAVVGDISQNLLLLSQDAEGIAAVLDSLEQDAARLFNLTAASQNTLRQQVREQVFGTTRRRYEESFISDAGLDPSGTASYDFGVGMASLPFLGETRITPSRIEIGVVSDGSLASGLELLTDGREETSLVWNGSQMELVFTFSAPTVLNRIQISLDDYQGLNLDLLASSPDGILREDLLAGLSYEARALDGSSNKFSGDAVLDFDPRHVKQLRLVLSDRVGKAQIRLRGVSFWARRYAATGVVQTRAIDFPALGLVSFAAVQSQAPQLTSIAHQLSFDGVQYFVVSPGVPIDLGARRAWYRASFARLESNFEALSAPLDKPGQDPVLSPVYKVNSLRTSDLGNGVLERVINLDLLAPASVTLDTRNVVLHDDPLPGTFTIYQGQTLLGDESYVLRSGVLQFTGDEERDGLLITYQTSAFANAGLVARRDFFTPRLYQITFTRL